VDYRIRQVLLVLRLLRTNLQLLICWLLQTVSKVVTVLDPWPAQRETWIDLLQPALVVVEAVHRAAGWLEVHRVELLVQKRIEVYLAVFQALFKTFEHLRVHVFESVATFFVQIKEFAHFIWRLLIWVKIHVSLLLQFLPSLKFILLPRLLPLLLEESRLLLVKFIILCSLCLMELLHGFSVLSRLPLIQVQIRELYDTVQCFLLWVTFLFVLSFFACLFR
jgi:hypothetical protein